MELKVQWLFGRRQQVAKEMEESDTQLREMLEGLVVEVQLGKKEMIAMRDAAKEAEVVHREEMTKFELQARTLEGLVVSKDDAIQQLKASNAQLQAAAEDRNTSNQQYYARLLQLQHLLAVQKSEAERSSLAYSKDLQGRSQAHLLELARAKKDYDEQLAGIQNSMAKAHQQELADLKRSNLMLLQRLDDEQQSLTTKSTENSRKAQSQCGRLIAQNTRLLATANEGKLKIMTLQASLTSQTQQTRILQKQLEIFKENSKREITFLTEERTALADKNRKMTDKLDELSWANKDGELRKAEEMERIKREIDRSFQEVLERAREECSAVEEDNRQLHAALQQKTEELHELQLVCMRIKELFEAQEKDTIKIQQEKQALERQIQAVQQSLPAKANEQMKKELIRKNCEAEVLQDEIKRLKGKVNTAAAAQQQFNRAKQALLQQNKMLLGEILFLKKEKERVRRGGQSRVSRNGNFLSDMDSERSKEEGELEQYKKVIEMMTVEMNDVCLAVKEKDARIDKLEALVKRYERELRDVK